MANEKFSEITVQKLTDYNKFTDDASYSTLAAAIAANAGSDPAYGCYFEMDGRDDKYLILIHNSAGSGDAKTVTIKAGNGIQGVEDISKSVAYGKYTLVAIESGRFKNVTENATLKALSSTTTAVQVSAKGKVFITGTDANIKVAVFRLP